MPGWIRRSLAAALVAAATAGTVEGAAQEGPRLTLAAGVSQFDLSGTGDAFTAAVRLDGNLRSYILWEGSVGISFPDQAFGNTTLLIPEAQIQVQWPARFAPYVGVGTGIALDFQDDEFGGTEADATFSGALGARIDLTEQFGLRGELRVRGIGAGFEGAAAEWTVGASWRF